MEYGVLKGYWDGLVASGGALLNLDFDGFIKANKAADAEVLKIWQEHQDKLHGIVKGPTELFSTVDAYLAKMNNLKPVRVGGDGEGEDDPETEAARKKRERQAERDADELERKRTQYANSLQQLQESLMTETEAEQAAYDARLAQLEGFYESGALLDADYRKLLTANAEQHEENMKKINDEITRDRERAAKLQERAAWDTADTILSTLDSVFKDSKAVALAQAVVNTAQAVTKTLAEYGATPWGLAAAAAAAVAGAAQIATIIGASKNSGGGGRRGGGGAVPAVASPGSSGGGGGSSGGSMTYFISGLKKDELYSGEQIAELLKEYQRNGGKVVIEK